MADNRYNQRGVSAGKEDVHKAIENIDKGLFPNAFCKIVPDLLSGSEDHCVVMHADGAGTKSSLAYMYWKETGDLSVWKGIAQDALIMNIDDLLCVGATDNILVSSTIGRNKNLINGDVIGAIINGTEDILSDLRDMGIGVYSTGGETADVGDLVRSIIVDSTVVARMKRSDVISNRTIQAGDVIVGLSSSGQASYEKEYNGGMGSNGLTSARHDVFHNYLAEKYPESFDPSIPEDLVYSGKYKLTDDVENSPIDAGKLVLSPTRTYAPIIKKILDNHRSDIHGMIVVVERKQKCCILLVIYTLLKTTSSLFHLCLKQFTKNQEQIGKRCTKSLIWDTAWSFTFLNLLHKTLSLFLNPLMSMHKLLDV